MRSHVIKFSTSEGHMQPLNTEGAEETAGNTLYMRFAPTIFAYLSRQVANVQDAEDVLLEVFLKAHKETILEELPEERQLAWLRRVARNTVIDRYRHSALLALLPLEQAAEMEDDQLTPEQRVERQEKYTRLYQALRHLSPAQQELIQLRYGNGLRFAEIAGMLARPEGTLRKLLARTLRQLRTRYDQLERGK
jgi:RNA polymerase sigma factor (sigma-70 family)